MYRFRSWRPFISYKCLRNSGHFDGRKRRVGRGDTMDIGHMEFTDFGVGGGLYLIY